MERRRNNWLSLAWLGAALALGLSGFARAQVPVLTEAEVVAAVRAQNPGLQAAGAGAAADALRPAQVRWPFPMVELMPMPGMILDGELGAQVMARQAVPWPARLAAERTAGARLADASAYGVEALDLELVALARSTYAALWGLQEQMARIEAYRADLELYREAALAQYRAGRGPQQAVLGIQVEGEVLAQRLDGLAEDRAAVAARLDALTGAGLRVDPGTLVSPPVRAAAPAAPVAREALDAHPALEAGRAMQAAEEAMVAAARTRLRPELTLGLNLNLSRMAFDREFGLEPVMPAVGLMLPLWRGGVRAGIEEAGLRARQRELETEETRLALEAELTAALEGLDRVRARIARYEDRLRPQVQQTIDAYLAGYRAGTVRFLELLDARRMALDVDVDLIMARVSEAGLAARLDALVGRAAGPGGNGTGGAR
jgi:outer membrane protein, heavy metal efflux system